MLNIADVLYHGIAFDPKNWNRDAVARDIAAASERLLDALKRDQIPFTLVGDLAMLSHIEGRNTCVIDLIVSLSDLTQVQGIEVQEVNEQFAMIRYAGLRVNALRPECPVFQLVHRQFSELREFEHRTIRTATMEGLMLLKLFAIPAFHRSHQIEKTGLCEADITSLIHHGCTTGAELLQSLKPHLEEGEFSELRQVLTDLEKKYTARPTTWGSGKRPSPPQ